MHKAFSSSGWLREDIVPEMSPMSHRGCIHSFKPTRGSPAPTNHRTPAPTLLPTPSAHLSVFHPPPKGRALHHPSRPPTGSPHPPGWATVETGHLWTHCPTLTSFPGAAPTHPTPFQSPQRVPEASTPGPLIGELVGESSGMLPAYWLLCVSR